MSRRDGLGAGRLTGRARGGEVLAHADDAGDGKGIGNDSRIGGGRYLRPRG